MRCRISNLRRTSRPWTSSNPDLIEEEFVHLPAELRYAVRSNLTVLSLMQSMDGMPDPKDQRARIAALLARLAELEVMSS
jgi:hypothetical protein